MVARKSRYASGLAMYHGGSNNITYRGTEGELPGRPGRTVSRVDIPGYRGGRGIFGDFIHCAKTRERPFREIEIAHRACSVCHLGNIALWTGEKLKWDAASEQISNHPAANRFLTKTYRKPLVLPSV